MNSNNEKESDDAGILIRPIVKLESDMNIEQLQIRLGEMAAEIEKIFQESAELTCKVAALEMENDRLQSVIDEANAQSASVVSYKNSSTGTGVDFLIVNEIPEGETELYARPMPAQSHDVEREEIIRLIEAVRKWGVDHPGCEPSISCFHQAVDNLRIALDNPPAIPAQQTSAVAVPDDKKVRFGWEDKLSEVIKPFADWSARRENLEKDIAVFVRGIELGSGTCFDEKESAAAITAIRILLREFQLELSPRITDPTELEMHRADYRAIKSAGYESPSELLAAYNYLLSNRVTEQDAREIAVHIFGFVGIGNFTAAFDSWFNNMGGLALLDKLNKAK